MGSWGRWLIVPLNHVIMKESRKNNRPGKTMPSKRRRIALTGGIASGKTLVGDYLQKKNIPVIDADALVHQLLREDAKILAKLRDTFGPAAFDADDHVDRKKLGALVFEDTDKRRLLESWIHPKVRDLIDDFDRRHQAHPVTVSIIPLLFESCLQDRYDEVWLIETSEAVQLQRLLEKRHMSEAEAVARLRSQMPTEEKRRCLEAHACGRSIRNAGAPQDVYAQIDQLLAAAMPPD
jgi:dephospho-CoA kinase